MPTPFEDRRRIPIRQRAATPPPWASGWLCFESRNEKRRLIPVPDSWDECSEEELERYRQIAVVCAKMPPASP